MYKQCAGIERVSISGGRLKLSQRVSLSYKAYSGSERLIGARTIAVGILNNLDGLSLQCCFCVL